MNTLNTGTQLSDSYFETLKKLRPYMEDYSNRLLLCFDDFLHHPAQDSILSIYKLRNDNISNAAANSFPCIYLVHTLTDIVSKEFSCGLTLITNNTHTYKEALDKYHKTVFSIRRHEFMPDAASQPLLDEAIDFIMSENISSIAISHIITNELVGNREQNMLYWSSVLCSAGRSNDALFLEKLCNLKVL